jgi:hypothetical protein
MKKWLLCSTFVLCICCGTLPLKQNKHLAKTTIELGEIGLKKTGVHKTAFETTAIPTFTSKIRVSAQIIPFTKQRLKKYTKALAYLGKKNTLSLTEKTTPVFVKFQLLDNVAMVKAINGIANNELSKYIQQLPQSNLISSVHVVIPAIVLTQIQQADAYYLQTNKHKKQVLHLYKAGKEIKRIDLATSTIFEYGVSSFCWGEMANRKIELKTIVSGIQNCTEGTLKNVEKLKKKRAYSFKF